MKKMMIKRLTIVAAIVVGHVALFTRVYYGRRRGVWLCDSDSFLFGFPFLAAALAYAALFSRMITVTKRWQKVVLVSLAVAWIAVGSAVAGMSVAFTLMGT